MLHMLKCLVPLAPVPSSHTAAERAARGAGRSSMDDAQRVRATTHRPMVTLWRRNSVRERLCNAPPRRNPCRIASTKTRAAEAHFVSPYTITFARHGALVARAGREEKCPQDYRASLLGRSKASNTYRLAARGTTVRWPNQIAETAKEKHRNGSLMPLPPYIGQPARPRQPTDDLTASGTPVWRPTHAVETVTFERDRHLEKSPSRARAEAAA